jgi:hypothetical protein
MKYPGGQADADVTTHVAAKIVTSVVKILMIFIANLLIYQTGNGTLLSTCRSVVDCSISYREADHTWMPIFSGRLRLELSAVRREPMNGKQFG